MNQRISGGAIVVREGRILLVRHLREGSYDFLVGPGGGVRHDESAEAAAARETLEETGIVVRPIRLVYVEELFSDTTRHVKLWFLCEYVSGESDASGRDAAAEHIIAAGFFTREELEGRTVFPLVVTEERFWKSVKSGFDRVEYLGLRKMEFS